MRDPSWMQLNAQYRKPPPPAPARKEPGEGSPADPSSPEMVRLEAPPVDVDAEYPYLGAWLWYKRAWRSIWITGVLGWITIAGLAQVLPRIGAERVLGALFPIWGLVWFVGTLVSAFRIIGFSCPRCGHNYFHLGRSPAFQLKCSHCGLPKFAVNDAGKRLHQLKRPKD